MPSKVQELQGRLREKQEELAAIFEENKNEEGEYDFTAEQLEDVQARNEELNELGQELEKAREIDEIYQKNRQAIREANTPAIQLPLPSSVESGTALLESKQKRTRSLGEMFTEHESYKSRIAGNDFYLELPDFDLKTLMTTTAGFEPDTTRIDRLIESAQRRPMIQSFIPQTSTEQAAIVFMEETTFTNAAAATAEGGTYAESALEYTEQSETIRKIATFLPVTDEQLDDVPQVQSLINNRLTLMLLLQEEDQIIAGSGVAPNMTGFLNKPGVQTQAKGADPVPDAIYKGMTLVRYTGYADPAPQ